jgi:hypothetical protein
VVKIKRSQTDHDGKEFRSGTLLQNGKEIAEFEQSEFETLEPTVITPTNKAALDKIVELLDIQPEVFYPCDEGESPLGYKPTVACFVDVASIVEYRLKVLKRMSKNHAAKGVELHSWKRKAGSTQEGFDRAMIKQGFSLLMEMSVEDQINLKYWG